jgi:hypothetical protein
MSTALARNTDPVTSHMAADRSKSFAPTHCSQIMAVLLQDVATAARISELTGLTVVQIDRRLPELERRGFARPVEVFGHPLIVGGYRVWEAV